MELQYSTSGIDASRRFDYWNDVVCRHCVPASSSMLTSAPFNGQLAVRSVGVVDISVMSAPLHHWSRDEHHIRKRDDDDMWIGYMHSGHGVIEQAGRQASLRDQSMALYDAARPFKFTLASDTLYLARFPRRALLQRCAAAERLTAVTLDGNKPVAVQLRTMIEQAATIDFQKLRSSAADQFGSTLLDLLGLALEFQYDDIERRSEVDLYSRVVAYIKRNFLNPELCLDLLATAHHVSTRTVTRAFAKHRHTAMGMVWQMRLEASHCALMEGRARNVTEAALDHGFSDVSHFSQAFRKAFGCAPNTVMRARQGPST